MFAYCICVLFPLKFIIVFVSRVAYKSVIFIFISIYTCLQLNFSYFLIKKRYDMHYRRILNLSIRSHEAVSDSDYIVQPISFV